MKHNNNKNNLSSLDLEEKCNVKIPLPIIHVFDKQSVKALLNMTILLLLMIIPIERSREQVRDRQMNKLTNVVCGIYKPEGSLSLARQDDIEGNMYLCALILKYSIVLISAGLILCLVAPSFSSSLKRI